MRIYYNEWDKPTAAWLRELGAGCHLSPGYVDTRSIRDVQPGDLDGYEQCHFFAGIGGWPLALRLAGYEHLLCWTGSPPCQPFSVAGQQRGKDDDRHLAPVWLNLVRECRPPVLFGEQVADAIRYGWLDDLFDALEECGYACGAAVLPACGVGAPHIRKRLFFGAVRLDNAPSPRHFWQVTKPEGEAWAEARVRVSGKGRDENGLAHTSCEQCNRGGYIWQGRGAEHSDGCAIGRVADANTDRREPGRKIQSLCSERDAQHGGSASWMADPDNAGPQGWPRVPQCADQQPVGARGLEGRPAHPDHGYWSYADWLGCRDGKFRPVEPGTQPLAHGLPARVGRLRGYGNAIVPQVAATFIKEFLGAVAEIANAN